jgi:hypothetical protein
VPFRCPCVSFAKYYVWPHRVLCLAARLPQPVAKPAWPIAVSEDFTYHAQRYGTCRLRAGDAFAACSTAWGPAAALVRAAPYRLGQPAPTAPNRVWFGNITYLSRQGSNWLYLPVCLDRNSPKNVGYVAAEAAGRTCATRYPNTWSAPALG